MRLTGKFVDSETGKPLSEVNIDFFATSDMSGTPVMSYQTDDNGSFDVQAPDYGYANVQYPGYGQMAGSAGVFSGTIQLYPMSVMKIVNKVPWWTWVLLAGVVLAVIHFKYKKLF